MSPGTPAQVFLSDMYLGKELLGYWVRCHVQILLLFTSSPMLGIIHL